MKLSDYPKGPAHVLQVLSLGTMIGDRFQTMGFVVSGAANFASQPEYAVIDHRMLLESRGERWPGYTDFTVIEVRASDYEVLVESWPIPIRPEIEVLRVTPVFNGQN